MAIPHAVSFRTAAATLATMALVGSLCAPSANARPKIRQGFFAAYPGAVGSRLDSLPSNSGHCGVCHYSFNGGGTRNPYGVKVEAALPGFPNTDDGRRLAILSIEADDSDTDGFSNVTEITDLATYANTPTFAGLTPVNVGSVSNVDPNDILGYLVPATGADTSPPVVAVTAPDGGESWLGGSSHTVTWAATDNVGVTSVDLFYRDGESASWTMIARGLANGGSFQWFVHNTPTAAARVRAVARDAAGNTGSDSSDALFTILPTTGGTVATTLRDFDQPGTQPFGGGTFSDHNSCVTCHGGYDAAVEPGHNFRGTMMGQAARDPLFFACVAIAEQDAPSSGDLCLRCHTPFGWMSGRSNPTDGSQLIALDRDGVACDFCHRAVDPIYQAGVSPPEDQAVIGGLLPGHVPTTYSNGQYVVDPQQVKRGPFADAAAPHAFLASPFHRSSEFCGTCHDVSNPVFARVGAADYAPGSLDQMAASFRSDSLMPLERTYSEWKHSAFPGGVYAPEFAGNKPDGIVAICQDCHLADVSGKGCNDVAAPLRPDLPLHDMTGGNSWMPGVIAALYPGETDAGALADGAARAIAMLSKAALLDVQVQTVADSFAVTVTVTNRSGHKLPTGYPEGRRMWLHVVARDAAEQTVYESGNYDSGTGLLAPDPDLVVYEAHLGLSPALASGLGLAAGPTFHFALNDSVYKDNRIPPQGFANAAFADFGGAPVDDSRPAPRYPDGQNWDASSYPLPSTARTVVATLYYQTTSKEYVEFLRDENTTNTAGQDLYDLWVAHGRAAPVAMVADSVSFSPVDVPAGSPRGRVALAPLANPFHGGLELRLDLPHPAPVRLEIFDAQGRRAASRDLGMLGAGAHRLTWDGRGARGQDMGSGVFWAVVQAGPERLVRPVVRLR